MKDSELNASRSSFFIWFQWTEKEYMTALANDSHKYSNVCTTPATTQNIRNLTQIHRRFTAGNTWNCALQENENIDANFLRWVLSVTIIGRVTLANYKNGVILWNWYIALLLFWGEGRKAYSHLLLWSWSIPKRDFTCSVFISSKYTALPPCL